MAAPAGPQTPDEFAKQLSPDGSAVLLQLDCSAFTVLELPSFKV